MERCVLAQSRRSGDHFRVQKHLYAQDGCLRFSRTVWPFLNRTDGAAEIWLCRSRPHCSSYQVFYRCSLWQLRVLPSLRGNWSRLLVYGVIGAINNIRILRRQGTINALSSCEVSQLAHSRLQHLSNFSGGEHKSYRSWRWWCRNNTRVTIFVTFIRHVSLIRDNVIVFAYGMESGFVELISGGITLEIFGREKIRRVIVVQLFEGALYKVL